MQVRLARLDARKAKKTVILFSRSGNRLLPQASLFDQAYGGVVSKALKNSRFNSASGQVFLIPTPALQGVSEVIVAGLGAPGKLKANSLRETGIALGKEIDRIGSKTATLVMEPIEKSRVNGVDATVECVEGIYLALYRFENYKTTLKPADAACFETLNVMVDGRATRGVKTEIEKLDALFAGVNLTRDLVNHPANTVNALYIAKEAEALKQLGLEVQVLRQKELEQNGLRLMLSVNNGSDNEPALIIMKWNGAGKKAPKHALVGKGVTYDTGGYSIKPSDGMVSMKGDMAGAAAIVGTMKSLAGRKAKVNVVGVAACVENMINGKATRPSDIIKSYKGLTVEINNTDAEGRLVLADALAYIIDKEQPAEVIDMATLTGACMVALGAEFAGLFSNSERMASCLTTAGEAAGENLWRLPVTPGYHRLLKSQVADVSNIGGRFGGASTAAAFLEKFVGTTNWAHIDIAGVALGEKVGGGSLPGANGFGVRLLTRYLESAAE